MASQARTTTPPALPEINQQTNQDTLAAHDRLTANLVEIDATYGDGLPYDQARLVNECRFYMAQSAEAMLEAGKRLILLKEHEPHGEFTRIVEERLGLSERAAQRMMQASIKYLSPRLQSKAPTLAVLGKSKLYELMVEDDEGLAALAEGGTVKGLSLDAIDRMSARELRAALRESHDDARAKDQVLADKNAKIDELATKLTRKDKHIQPADPDTEGAQLREEVGRFAFEAEAAIRGSLAQGFEALAAHAERRDCSHENFMSGCLAQIEGAMLQLRNLYQVKAAPDPDEVPEWVRQFQKEDATKAGTTAGAEG